MTSSWTAAERSSTAILPSIGTASNTPKSDITFRAGRIRNLKSCQPRGEYVTRLRAYRIGLEHQSVRALVHEASEFLDLPHRFCLVSW